ncbi:MAG TPA: phosphoribosylamine--glycine ligase [Burkholderiaceae bacterium]|nr:phosphoribosylamine--glycine ligase [Burkholderiaceae bacterium]
MKALVIGSGGREHALAWKLGHSRRLSRIFVAPGNGGTARDRRLQNVPITDPEALAEFAQREDIGLTVVGPEAPLAAGVVDTFRARNLRIFGPTKAAAQLESSKDFAKAFMQRHGIPTAEYQTFTRVADAHAYLDRKEAPIVVKADGLAAGKGVVVAQTRAEAKEAVEAMLALGGAGARVVIEDFLAGEEASFIVMSDGRNVLALATSQDHKRLGDGDTGPNTGGMGAYSPAPVVTPQLHAKVMREIIVPAVNGMASDGVPYVGFLYAGLMIGAENNAGGLPSVHTLEFNCRLGDPETQPILMRLKTDLVHLLNHALNGRLDEVKLEWDRRTALGVVLAAHGYPDEPRHGDEITALAAEARDCVTFHAATAVEGDRLRVTGGRVLCVTALGDSVRTAQKRAYDAIAKTHFDGMQYRHDIGHHALKPRG